MWSLTLLKQTVVSSISRFFLWRAPSICPQNPMLKHDSPGTFPDGGSSFFVSLLFVFLLLSVVRSPMQPIVNTRSVIPITIITLGNRDICFISACNRSQSSWHAVIAFLGARNCACGGTTLWTLLRRWHSKVDKANLWEKDELSESLLLISFKIVCERYIDCDHMSERKGLYWTCFLSCYKKHPKN